MTAEGQYVWNRRETAPILLANSPGWYLSGLSWLRHQEEHIDGPRFILSQEGLVLGSVLPSSVARWDDVAGRIIPLSGADRAAIDLERSRLDPEGDLSIGFEKEGDLLRWSVGPAGGHFTMITVPLYDDFPLPDSGARRLPRSDEKQSFLVRRDAEDGRWTVSPVFDLPRPGDSVHWRRVKGSAP